MKQLFSRIGRTLTAHEALIKLEPGLLPLFRAMAALQFGMAMLGLVVNLIGVEQRIPVSTLMAGFGAAWTGLLCVYLFATRHLRWLGPAYLPVALSFATVSTLVQYLWEFPLLTEIMQHENKLVLLVSVSGWRLLSGLLTPLLIIASQYGWRSIGLFIAVAIGAEIYAFRASFSSYAAMIVLIIVQTFVFGLIGYIVNHLITAQRTQRLALAAANAQLAQHAATLEQLTISRERNRLARELHDTLAHTLSAVSVQLEAIDSAWEAQPAKARELLGKSLAQTRSGLTETRRALQSLRASPLDDLGLPLALRTLAETTAKRGGLQLTAAIADVELLTPEVEQQIYRIAQEALTNVLKHSGARTLQVALAQTVGGLTFSITDDGQGFDSRAIGTNGHFGLRGIQERAELIGATVQIESAPGRGALIRLMLPEG